MVTLRPYRSPRGPALSAVLGPLLLTGCALIQPPPVPSLPGFGLRAGLGDAVCATYISQAHAALAAAGAAAGDASATAAAHAAHAAAMHSYHVCLARRTAP